MEQDSIPLLLLLQIALIALNAVFACAEIALISINDAKLSRLASEGDKRAVRLVKLTSQPARFLATIQVAITLSGFLGSAFAAENFSGRIVEAVVKMGVPIPAATLNAIAVVLITLILSYFTLVFGELVPKRVAMRNAEKLALAMSGFIYGISKLFAPVVWMLTASTNAVLRFLGIDPNAEDEEVSEEEIRMMVDVGSEKGAIDEDEKEMIQNVFEFDDITASEIATHRTELSALWMEDSMEEWDELIHDTRYTLYPVCTDSIDNIVGILNAKDYFRIREKTRENVMAEAVRKAYFVPESVKADVLFKNMKALRNNMAVVLDEYGGVSGIVTVNDLLEQLVGEFEMDGEDALEEPLIEKAGEGVWKIRGSALLTDIEEALGITLPLEEDYDTFNGLVFDALGSIPPDGEKVDLTAAGLEISVRAILDHQIELALVRCTDKPQEETEDKNA